MYPYLSSTVVVLLPFLAAVPDNGKIHLIGSNFVIEIRIMIKEVRHPYRHQCQ